MADDIEHGAGLLERLGVPQADIYHVEYQGKHPVILQREIGRNLPPNVVKEETWQKAVDAAGGSLSPEFEQHRLAVLRMQRKLADGGAVWEDSNKNNFFFQRVKREDGSEEVRAAVSDQDRIDYVRDFGDGRKPRPRREPEAWFSQMGDDWRKAAAKLPADVRPLSWVDGDPHLLSLVSLWRKKAFTIDSSGRAVDGWLKVDEIREVFGEHFVRLMKEQ
jgi:hypothetical protein